MTIPIIDRPVDNTALQAYLACPREYAFSMILHRRKKAASAALVYGAAWHKAMEIHYKTDGDRAAVMLGTTAAWEQHDSEDDYRTLARVLMDYDRYVKEWGKPTAEMGKTVGWPDSPLVEISTNAQGDGLIHPWAGKIDRIIDIGGLLYIEDHKTTSRLDKNYFNQFNLSPQMMGYTYLGRQLLPDRKIAGVRINLAHITKTKTEFNRQLFTFSDSQISEWINNVNMWIMRLGADIEFYLRSIENGEDSYEALFNGFPAHFGDNGCSRKFGMCAYHEVCSAPIQIRKRLIEQEFDIRPWNPLEIEDEHD